MDYITEQRIERLHPMIRDEVRRIIHDCDATLKGRSKIRITQGLRTFKEQDALYAIGRTLHGKKVTNAKGGQSIHNYGFAVDICLIIDGKTASWDIKKDWDADQKADWHECVEIFSRYGWEWGGDWKTFKDRSHFQKRTLLTQKGSIQITWQRLSQLKRDQDGYVIF